MIETGVASPIAQGQATISTATPATSAWLSRGSGPKSSQAATVSAAIARIAGTNHSVTRLTSAWIGSRAPCASSTMPIIRLSTVSAPTAVARMTSVPVPFTVPPVTLAPRPFSTGSGSPVSIASSTWLAPSATSPSTGSRAPRRDRHGRRVDVLSGASEIGAAAGGADGLAGYGSKAAACPPVSGTGTMPCSAGSARICASM